VMDDVGVFCEERSVRLLHVDDVRGRQTRAAITLSASALMVSVSAIAAGFVTRVSRSLIVDRRHYILISAVLESHAFLLSQLRFCTSTVKEAHSPDLHTRSNRSRVANERVSKSVFSLLRRL